ncbi:uncharacterized protein LOC131681111 [Topomyia yanbarensis]|uniref:uncharacterized protein LOC131681111 n=1 Tax=Topomyia yanbarensis TaxID=2498891 RepID=UPI00273AB342|nr:uncharacterized protein LOC131681111 [Topomyia yanbarensis]
MNCRQTLLSKTLFNGFTFILRCFGLSSYNFSSSNRAFYYSDITLVYTIAYLLAYAYFLGQYFESSFHYISDKSPQLSGFLVAITFSAVYLGGIVPCLIGLVYRKNILILYNNYIRLWFTLKQGTPENFDKKIGYNFIFKLIVIDGFTIIGAVGIRLRHYWLSGDAFLLYDALFNVFILAVNACVTNLFVAVAYLGAHYFRLLNYRVGKVNGMLKELDPKRHYWRSESTKKEWMYDRLIQELHMLARLHGEINRTVQRFMELHDPSLLVLVIKSFVVLITGLHGAYTAVIETFSLELLHRDNKITNSGLYCIDFSLIYADLATMINYLIIIVQFQMTNY